MRERKASSNAWLGTKDQTALEGVGLLCRARRQTTGISSACRAVREFFIALVSGHSSGEGPMSTHQPHFPPLPPVGSLGAPRSLPGAFPAAELLNMAIHVITHR